MQAFDFPGLVQTSASYLTTQIQVNTKCFLDTVYVCFTLTLKKEELVAIQSGVEDLSESKLKSWRERYEALTTHQEGFSKH